MNPQSIDYDKLAQQHGGSAGSTVDYEALAREHGGAPASQPRTWLDEVGDYAKGAWKHLNPVSAVEGLVQLTNHPIEAGKGILEQNGQLAAKAEKAFKSGDYLSGSRHVLTYLMNAVPGLGAAADSAADKIQEGKVAEGLGEATGVGLAMAGPARLPKVSTVVKSVAKSAPVRQALEFAERRNIPVDVATATDNQFLRGAQQVASSTLGGSIPAAAGKRAQATAMTRVSGELAAEAHPVPVSPESAGQAVRGAIEEKIGAIKGQADAAYNEFRAAAEDAANLREVEVGRQVPEEALFQLDQLAMGQARKPYGQLSDIERQHVDRLAAKIGIDATPQPVTQAIALPVDMRPIKAALQKQYSEMQQWMEPARRNASQGFQAVKSIVEGPDFRPAVEAEHGLSGLKQLAREAPSDDLRNVNQGIGANGARQLQAAIDAAAEQGGGEALAALQRGRAAHASKMDLADVAKQLRDEPVQAFRQAAWEKDTGIAYLRKLNQAVPGEMPKIGRAYLENLFQKATSDGGFAGGKGLYAEWQRLGPQTKELLFRNPVLRQDLDSFFLLAKRMAEVPNPSGTAATTAAGRVLDVASGGAAYTGHFLPVAVSQIGVAGLTALMYSPRALRMMISAMKAPAQSAARTMALGSLMKMAQHAGVDQEPRATLTPAAAH